MVEHVEQDAFPICELRLMSSQELFEWKEVLLTQILQSDRDHFIELLCVFPSDVMECFVENEGMQGPHNEVQVVQVAKRLAFWDLCEDFLAGQEAFHCRNVDDEQIEEVHELHEHDAAHEVVRIHAVQTDIERPQNKRDQIEKCLISMLSLKEKEEELLGFQPSRK